MFDVWLFLFFLVIKVMQGNCVAFENILASELRKKKLILFKGLPKLKY